MYEEEAEREKEREEGQISAPNLQPHFSATIFLSSHPAPFLLRLLALFSAGTPQFHSLRKLSQDPVQTPIPSSGTPVQLTLLS